jgi:phosphatidylglycerophosphatase A
VTAVRATAQFLFARPAHFIALGFGSGLSPLAPGTFGTLVAIPLAMGLRAFHNDAVFIGAIAVAFVVGAWSAQATGRDLGVPDHGSIVVDEIAAFLLVLYFVGPDPLREALAFILFRAFDIWKPPPIRQVDAALKNGIGVMLDDVLAALYALIVFALGQRLFGG